MKLNAHTLFESGNSGRIQGPIVVAVYQLLYLFAINGAKVPVRYDDTLLRVPYMGD